MGVILEPTADMGGWSVEMRRESFYLSDPEPEFLDGGGWNPNQHFQVLPTGLAFPASQVPHILAALDQAQEWRDEHGQNTEDGPRRLDGVKSVGGPIVLVGDVGAASLAYLREHGRERTGALELTYADARFLRSALADA